MGNASTHSVVLGGRSRPLPPLKGASASTQIEVRILSSPIENYTNPPPMVTVGGHTVPPPRSALLCGMIGPPRPLPPSAPVEEDDGLRRSLPAMKEGPGEAASGPPSPACSSHGQIRSLPPLTSALPATLPPRSPLLCSRRPSPFTSALRRR